MHRKFDPPPAFVRIDQARELMDHGRYRESLMVALEALLQELNTLRDSLAALKKIVLAESQATAAETPK
ncbi:MAG: hypothetical protein M0P73_17365, partial [Syntrophobacterales bacterium]|nr:hypothetical protein [Syntrophobacterales bacterium]